MERRARRLRPVATAARAVIAALVILDGAQGGQTAALWANPACACWGVLDGLTWACSDLSSSDGTHPSTTGQQKVASILLDFVRTDATAREWFLR